MKASEIISRARDLADLPNTKAISHDFEIQSLNEAWRDCYQVFTDSDDDFYVTEAVVALTPAMAVGTAEYLVPLPVDFYKLRYLDVQDGTGWLPVKKFPLSMKNVQPGDMYYRIRGTSLWIIGGVALAPPTIRIGYYPPPAQMSVPEQPVEYVAAEPKATFGLVTFPFYIPERRTMIYVYNGVNIRAESADLQTTVVLLAAFANPISSLIYYKGYIYFISNDDIWRAPTDLATVIVPVQITAIAAPITTVTASNDKLYFATGGSTRSCNLDGTGMAVLFAGTSDDVHEIDGVLVYRDVGTNDVLTFPATAVIAPDILHLTSDGREIYVVDTSYNFRRILADVTTGAVSEDVTLRSDVLYIENVAVDLGTHGSYHNHRASIITKESQLLLANSTLEDTDFNFPINFNPEIIEYKCAIDFRGKVEKDSAALIRRLYGGGANDPLGLWGRFVKVAHRDEYKHERIQNVYAYGGGR